MLAAGEGWQRPAGMELELAQAVRRVSRSLGGEASWCPTQPDFTSEDFTFADTPLSQALSSTAYLSTLLLIHTLGNPVCP